MNLVIDQGNSVVKMAVYSEGEMVVRYVEKDLQLKNIERIFDQYKMLDKAILSNVALFKDDVKQFLEISTENFIILDEKTRIPLKNYYSTKGTLGYDRIANVVGAHTIFPGKDVLVIDAGTAITFDLVTAAGAFIGGNISPGIDLRFKALNQFTSKLPLVEKSEKIPFLGTTTHDAILSGVITSVIFEIEGYTGKLKDLYPGLQIILTGGDANYLVEKLKNIIFVDSNITLTGLNRILEYNAK